ncbi:unnamed protein product [Prorocentrum cordatum]|uniref:Uncharacterized protein n=1 Tax=Prorocentrum cordatum TaxID=2364126 RepID=A0ABN9QSQ1_9DINO|nr:unnamed protein product [Polarella glacialis]
MPNGVAPDSLDNEGPQPQRIMTSRMQVVRVDLKELGSSFNKSVIIDVPVRIEIRGVGPDTSAERRQLYRALLSGGAGGGGGGEGRGGGGGGGAARQPGAARNSQEQPEDRPGAARKSQRPEDRPCKQAKLEKSDQDLQDQVQVVPSSPEHPEQEAAGCGVGAPAAGSGAGPPGSSPPQPQSTAGVQLCGAGAQPADDGHRTVVDRKKVPRADLDLGTQPASAHGAKAAEAEAEAGTQSAVLRQPPDKVATQFAGAVSFSHVAKSMGIVLAGVGTRGNCIDIEVPQDTQEEY